MGSPDGYQVTVLPCSDASQTQVFPVFLIQGKKVYQFKTLPFGLSMALKMFTQCIQPILPYCHKLGIMLFLYLDDVLVLGDTYGQAKTNGWIAAKLLPDLSFILSLEKCNFKPMQVGVTWNTMTMMLLLPLEKVQAIQKQARHVLRNLMYHAVQHLLGLTNCKYCLTAHQAAIATATMVAEAALQRSIWHVQDHAYNGGSSPQSRMVAVLKVTSQEYSQAFSPRSHNDRCFNEGLQQRMQLASLLRQMAREQGQRHAQKSPQTRVHLEGVQQVQVQDKGKATSFQINNQTPVAYLMKERGTRC